MSIKLSQSFGPLIDFFEQRAPETRDERKKVSLERPRLVSPCQPLRCAESLANYDRVRLIMSGRMVQAAGSAESSRARKLATRIPLLLLPAPRVPLRLGGYFAYCSPARL